MVSVASCNGLEDKPCERGPTLEENYRTFLGAPERPRQGSPFNWRRALRVRVCDSVYIHSLLLGGGVLVQARAK